MYNVFTPKLPAFRQCRQRGDFGNAGASTAFGQYIYRAYVDILLRRIAWDLLRWRIKRAADAQRKDRRAR